MRFILASQSPRRKEILGYFSFPFECFSPLFAEESILFNGNFADYVNTLSKCKNDTVAQQILPNDSTIILSADTIVAHRQKIYGKPKNRDEAFQILNILSGQEHSVMTSLTIRKKDQLFTDLEETKVAFHQITEMQINQYLNKIDFLDKAAGYAIQGSGGVIVRSIDGCYYNVMGLPLNALSRLFNKIGMNLWEYLK